MRRDSLFGGSRDFREYHEKKMMMSADAVNVVVRSFEGSDEWEQGTYDDEMH